VRLRKADLRARVNADLALRFRARGLTSYAGLEMVRRYFVRIDLYGRLRRHVAKELPGSDYGPVAMIVLLLGLIILGGRRLEHLRHLGDDPLLLRLCGLRRIPSSRSVGRWLSRLRCKDLSALRDLVRDIAYANIERAGVARLTVDVDGTVVSTGLKVRRARRGYNPHHRKVPSYYPITAFEAQSGQIIKVQNRPGNVHDGKASVTFLRSLLKELRCGFGSARVIEFRMDGAFFRDDVIGLLERNGAEYTIKVPFYRWLGLKQLVAARRRWTSVDAKVDYFEKQLRVEPWGRTMRVAIYRKRVRHEAPKNYQLDLFDPDDGHYEYSAIVTNKELTPSNIWWFMCGRGGHEKAYGELKTGFAFACVPTLSYAANSAWQLLSVLAFNLMRGLQMTATATVRTTNRKRRPVFVFQSIHTQRYQWLGKAGVVVEPQGHATLDVGTNHTVRRLLTTMADSLAKAA
jgi:hypothetical protein